MTRLFLSNHGSNRLENLASCHPPRGKTQRDLSLIARTDESTDGIRQTVDALSRECRLSIDRLLHVADRCLLIRNM
jgi:hypothetical protein